MNNIFVCDFNSIKVQLKLADDRQAQPHCIFQFHKGTIKTLSSIKRSWLRSDFNSIKVQLKPSTFSTASISARFQFHKGTIKTSE